MHPGVLHGSGCAKSAAAFLRNSFHWGDLLAGVSQLWRASAHPLEDALPILRFIVRGPGVLGGHAIAQSIVKEPGQCARCRRHRLCFPHPRRQPPVEGPEGGRGFAHVDGGEAQELGRSIGGAAGCGPSELPARELGARCSGQPGSAVLGRGPCAHVRAPLANAHQGRLSPTAMELRPRSAQQLAPGGPNGKSRFSRVPGPRPSCRQCPRWGRLRTGGQGRGNGLRTRSAFRLITVLHFQSLPEREDVVRALSPRSRLGHGLDRGVTADSAGGGPHGRLVGARDKRAHDLHPRGSRDVCHDGMQLAMHPHSRLLPRLHMGRGLLPPALPMPQGGPEGRPGRGGADTAAEQSMLVERREPDSLMDVRLPSRNICHVPGMDHEHLSPPCLQHGKGRNPVHPRRCQRDCRAAERYSPIAPPVEGGRQTLKGSHGLWGTVRGHRHHMQPGPDVHPCGMGMDGAQRRLLPSAVGGASTGHALVLPCRRMEAAGSRCYHLPQRDRPQASPIARPQASLDHVC